MICPHPYSKLLIPGITSSKYNQALSRMYTTIDKISFLQLLMMQAHILLAIICIVIQDIPKYSNYRDLYKYSKATIMFTNHHKMNHRVHHPPLKKISEVYVSYLDERKYAMSITAYTTAILHTTIPTP